jgi:ammonia channel protein AmtB
MLIGLAGGILSAFGFQKIGPFLAEKIHLSDTCGVNSLHGMPGIAAAIISAIVVSGAGSADFPEDYFPASENGTNLGK